MVQEAHVYVFWNGMLASAHVPIKWYQQREVFAWVNEEREREREREGSRTRSRCNGWGRRQSARLKTWHTWYYCYYTPSFLPTYFLRCLVCLIYSVNIHYSLFWLSCCNIYAIWCYYRAYENELIGMKLLNLK